MEEQVLEILTGADDPVPTLVIARALHGPGSTRKTVNPLLYQMERAGKITKVAEENGANPRWTLRKVAPKKHHHH